MNRHRSSRIPASSRIIHEESAQRIPGRNPLSSTDIRVQISLRDKSGQTAVFHLGDPVPAGRKITFYPHRRSPNAFHLPLIVNRTYRSDRFVADVELGGSCNVEVLEYVPHGMTHIETAAHILPRSAKPALITQLPASSFVGVALLIDLSDTAPGSTRPSLISWRSVRKRLETNHLPISMLALKTRASLLREDHDFSGTNFTALSWQAARGIHEYSIGVEDETGPASRIMCLIVDLPSVDPENDGGKLLAHRHFFGLTGLEDKNRIDKPRCLVELAYFAALTEGYYYVTVAPPRFATDAVSTGLLFQPMRPVS